MSTHQQILNIYIQYTCKSIKLNIRYEPLSAFYSLNCVFINVNTDKLKSVCKLALRYFHLFTQQRNVFTAQIVFSVRGFVYEHIIHPPTFYTAVKAPFFKKPQHLRRHYIFTVRFAPFGA